MRGFGRLARGTTFTYKQIMEVFCCRCLGPAKSRVPKSDRDPLKLYFTKTRCKYCSFNIKFGFRGSGSLFGTSARTACIPPPTPAGRASLEARPRVALGASGQELRGAIPVTLRNAVCVCVKV